LHHGETFFHKLFFVRIHGKVNKRVGKGARKRRRNRGRVLRSKLERNSPSQTHTNLRIILQKPCLRLARVSVGVIPNANKPTVCVLVVFGTHDGRTMNLLKHDKSEKMHVVFIYNLQTQ
jgi:hypothetical protein